MSECLIVKTYSITQIDRKPSVTEGFLIVIMTFVLLPDAITLVQPYGF